MGKVNTTYGSIWVPDGPCRDDYPNITTNDWDGQIVKLQEAARRSFADAERAYAHRTRPKADSRQIGLTGSWRSCEYQRSLWLKDKTRYANPDETLHTRGLAIDVSQAQPNLALIDRLLRTRGWKQARADEPWHYSYWFLG